MHMSQVGVASYKAPDHVQEEYHDEGVAGAALDVCCCAGRGVPGDWCKNCHPEAAT